jgi:hypothetical protein
VFLIVTSSQPAAGNSSALLHKLGKLPQPGVYLATSYSEHTEALHEFISYRNSGQHGKLGG